MPIMPSESGCAAGKAPRPSSVEATGICCDSAKARTSASCAGFDDAVAGEDDGLLGLLDELDGFADGVRLGAQHGVRAIGRGCGGVEVEDGARPAVRPW